MARFGDASNGLIEVVWGTPISFPPLTGHQQLVTESGENQIMQESHLAGETMPDWTEYANLAFLGVLNLVLQDRPEDARQLYEDTIAQFDGAGFRDKAYQERYETYKLAMALYTGSAIGAPNANSGQMLALLLSMQRTDGGFITHYKDQETPEGDANTETTSWALLALKEAGCPD